MTFGKWSKMYQAYKDIFDLENEMKNKGVGYADLEREITLDDVIPM